VFLVVLAKHKTINHNTKTHFCHCVTLILNYILQTKIPKNITNLQKYNTFEIKQTKTVNQYYKF